MERYLQRSQLVKKLRGFVEAQEQEQSAVAVQPRGGQREQRLPDRQSAAAAAGGASVGNADSADSGGGGGVGGSRHISALGHVYDFLLCLTNADCDGRVLATAAAAATAANGNRTGGGSSSGGGGGRDGEASLQFLLLNPAVHFRAVVDQARSVILAGGTMQVATPAARLTAL